jgi:PAS domain S-box-containing protein
MGIAVKHHLNVEALEQPNSPQQRTERINRALFNIASAVNATSDLDELYQSIHRTLGSIIDTTNFYIALYDPAGDAISFPYCVDDVDGCYPPKVGISHTASLTGDVIRKRKPALLTKADITAWRQQSRLEVVGCTPSEIWLGVPLLVRQEVIGVMAVQSYTDPDCYDQTDKEVMVAVAGQVALAIQSKRAADALQESNQRYRALADATFEAIFISENGVCIDTNRTATRMFGYAYDDLIGIFGTDVITPEDKETVRQHMLSGYDKPYEVLAQRKDGSRFYVEICGQMMTYQGKHVRVTVVRDIDQRKRAEQARRESERRFRELAEMLPETIYEVDTTGRILFVNKNGLDQFGYEQEDLKAGINAFDMIADEDRERAAANIARILAGEAVGLTEYTVRRKDGTQFPAMLLSSAIVRHGGPVGMRGFIIDLTEKRRLENQLQHAQKMEAIGTLAGGIAHDFNNILAAIMGYAEIALMDSPDHSMVHHNLSQVLKASHRAKGLVEQILSFSRQKDMKKKPIQVGPIVKEAAKLLRATLPATITFQTDIADDAGVVEGDPTQIHQIMMNLGANAGQAMGSAGGTLVIRLQQTRLDARRASRHPDLHPGPYLVLTVSDTGKGIPRDIQQRIFDPFFTTKENGTGMGLAVVHGIVKGHGGAILLENTAKQQTIFKVYLPVVHSTGTRISRPSGHVPSGTETILLVDDERLLTDMGTQMLQRLGYRVTATNSSVEALSLFRKTPGEYDLVITDMTMPHLTGDALAGEIMTVRPDIPVIICTGFNESLTAANSKANGIKALLMKPLQLQELATTIRQVLGEENTTIH